MKGVTQTSFLCHMGLLAAILLLSSLLIAHPQHHILSSSSSTTTTTTTRTTTINPLHKQFTAKLVQTLHNVDPVHKDSHPALLSTSPPINHMSTMRSNDNGSVTDEDEVYNVRGNQTNHHQTTVHNGIIAQTSHSIQSNSTTSWNPLQYHKSSRSFDSKHYSHLDHQLSSPQGKQTKKVLSNTPHHAIVEPTFNSPDDDVNGTTLTPLSVFERVSIYNNFVRSNVNHQLNQNSRDTIPTSDPKPPKPPKPLKHRNLQQFTALSLENNVKKLNQKDIHTPTDGYQPSHIVKTFNQEQLQNLPPVSLSLFSAATSTYRPDFTSTYGVTACTMSVMAEGDGNENSSIDDQGNDISSSSSSSSTSSQSQPPPQDDSNKTTITTKLGRAVITQHTTHVIDLVRNDDIFSPRFYIQRSADPHSPRSTAQPEMYHHYQGFLTMTEMIDIELLPITHPGNEDSDEVINPLDSSSTTTLSPNQAHNRFQAQRRRRGNKTITMSLDHNNSNNNHNNNNNEQTLDTNSTQLHHHTTNSSTQFSLNSHFFIYPSQTQQQKQQQKQQEEGTQHHPFHNTTDLYHRLQHFIDNRHLHNPEGQRDGGQDGEEESSTHLLQEVLRFILPDDVHDSTFLEYHQQNDIPGLAESHREQVMSSTYDVFIRSPSGNHDIDDDHDYFPSLSLVKTRVMNLALSIYPANRTLVGQAVDNEGLFTVVAALITDEDQAMNNQDVNDDVDDEVTNHTEINNTTNTTISSNAEYSPFNLNQLLQIDGFWDIKLTRDKPIEHNHDHHHHDHDHHGNVDNADVEQQTPLQPSHVTPRGLKKLSILSSSSTINDNNNSDINTINTINIDDSSELPTSPISNNKNSTQTPTDSTNDTSTVVDEPPLHTCGNPTLSPELRHFFAHPSIPFEDTLVNPKKRVGNTPVVEKNEISNQTPSRRLTPAERKQRFASLLDQFYSDPTTTGLNHVTGDTIHELDQRLKEQYKREAAQREQQQQQEQQLTDFENTNNSTTSFQTFQSPTSTYPITRGVIELGIANDYWRVQSIGGPDASDLYNSAARLVNLVDSLYNRASFDPPLRATVGLIVNPMTTLNDPIQINLTDDNGTAAITDANQYLDAFMGWSTYNMNIDAKVMLSGLKVRGSVIGLAVLSHMCQASSSGMVQAVYTESEAFTATVLAHEVGHMASMLHDLDNTEVDDDGTGKTVTCPTANNFIMGATASRPPATIFSDCSHAYYHNWLLSSSYATCLAERNHIYSGSVCGNGILEVGESCDCGSVAECKDTCCDAAMCQLKAGPQYQCSDQSSPCCKNCMIVGAKENQVCRKESNPMCDLPEYCDGYSSQCPLNIVQPTGTQCTIQAKVGSTGSGSSSSTPSTLDFAGLCYKGLCYSLEYTCAQNKAVVCPYQSSTEQCLNSKCLLYTKDTSSSTIADCFDPFALATGVGIGGGTSNPDPSDNGDDPDVGASNAASHSASNAAANDILHLDTTTGTDDNGATIPANVIPTTPNGIPCANSIGQCIQFQCLATTGGDGRVIRPPNAIFLGIPPIGVAIICVTIALMIAIVVICCILKHHRAKLIAQAAMNERLITQPAVSEHQFSSPRGGRIFHQASQNGNSNNNSRNHSRSRNRSQSRQTQQRTNSSSTNQRNRRGDNAMPLLPEEMDNGY